MRIAIYGAGALGTVIGAFAMQKKIETDLISRNENHISALKKNGATITGTMDFHVKVNALLIKEMKEQYDIIILATKQLDNREVVGQLKKYLKDDGILCTIQNGMPEMLISEMIGAEKTYGCAIGWGATMKEAGIVELTSHPDSLMFSLGTFGHDQFKKMEALKNLFSATGKVTVEQNFMGARYSKLLINSTFSGLSAISDFDFGTIAKNKVYRKIALSIIKECIDVAKAAQIKIEPVQGKDIVKLLDYHNFIKKRISLMIIPIAMKKHKLIKASMLQDLKNGKKCEIEAINGVVSALGIKHDVKTPYIDLTTLIVKEIESGKRKISADNFREFDKISKAS